MAGYIILLPLISSIICGFTNKYISKFLASAISSTLMTVSAMLAIKLFISINMGIVGVEKYILFQWFRIDCMEVNWSIYVDQLTATMFLIVTVVSAIVHIYSVGYMAEDKNLPRFMSYLSLFTFSMLMLVAADNLVQLFFGWEGVGVCSYLLIGFWYKKKSACAAAIKAFIVNRVADIALIIAILMIVHYVGSVNFNEIQKLSADLNNIPMWEEGLNALDVVCLLLMVGAMGKSAQIGLHVWLPDAMEGPTPVSALIHAATMVTAGVFLLSRLSFVFVHSSLAQNIVAIVGGVTCLFAASIAIAQTDIKKIIAYSTCSQIGYMFMACGVTAYQAAIFHLGTHAFFKAMLFLAAGNVIHATHEQDITKMGGLKDKLPYTYLLFWLGSLAIIGVFPLSGFYSKDLILESAIASSGNVGQIVFVLGVFAAFLTACYSIKILMLVFHGKTKLSEKVLEKAHEAPMIMMLPLSLLVLGTIFAGLYGHYYLAIGEGGGFFARSIASYLYDVHSVSVQFKLMPMLFGVIGMFCSYLYYSRKTRISENNFLIKLLANKYYFDEIYDYLFVRSLNSLSNLSRMIDIKIIDNLGPNLIAKVIKCLGLSNKKAQDGYIFSYAIYIIGGLIVILTIFLVEYINNIGSIS